MSAHKAGDLQVWWIPQVPMSNPFTVSVPNVAAGVALMQCLADYDSYQFENRIKPDYSNVGGLQRWCDDSDGEGTPGWEDWFDEETGEDDPEAWLSEQPLNADDAPMFLRQRDELVTYFDDFTTLVQNRIVDEQDIERARALLARIKEESQ